MTCDWAWFTPPWRRVLVADVHLALPSSSGMSTIWTCHRDEHQMGFEGRMSGICFVFLSLSVFDVVADDGFDLSETRWK